MTTKVIFSPLLVITFLSNSREFPILVNKQLDVEKVKLFDENFFWNSPTEENRTEIKRQTEIFDEIIIDERNSINYDHEINNTLDNTTEISHVIHECRNNISQLCNKTEFLETSINPSQNTAVENGEAINDINSSESTTMKDILPNFQDKIKVKNNNSGYTDSIQYKNEDNLTMAELKISSMKEMMVSRGSNVTMDCGNIGGSELPLVWTFNTTRELLDGEKYKVNTETGQLVVVDVKAEDQGEYSCGDRVLSLADIRQNMTVKWKGRGGPGPGGVFPLRETRN